MRRDPAAGGGQDAVDVAGYLRRPARGLHGRAGGQPAGGVEREARGDVGLGARRAVRVVRDRRRRAAQGVGQRAGGDPTRVGHVLHAAGRAVGVGRDEGRVGDGKDYACPFSESFFRAGRRGRDKVCLFPFLAESGGEDCACPFPACIDSQESRRRLSVFQIRRPPGFGPKGGVRHCLSRESAAYGFVLCARSLECAVIAATTGMPRSPMTVTPAAPPYDKDTPRRRRSDTAP